MCVFRVCSGASATSCDVFVCVNTLKGREALRVFTSRPETLCGVSYILISPEHPLCRSGDVSVLMWGRGENCVL